ncbi:MAG: VanZ family protein [Eubacteriales bacterium]
MNNKKNINSVIIILFILLIFNVSFIWLNSFLTSEISNNASAKIAEITQPIIDPYYNIPKDIFIDYIRKSAHFTEFFILGVVITVIHIIIKKTRITTVLFILLSIAVIDEFIQSFSDRTANVKDIILDYCGAILGFITVIITYFTLTLIINKVKYRKKNMIKRPDTL